jgi:mevalonate kinase
MEKTASATACGKVILLGEHAVVYGVPAIAAGIDRGAHATASRLEAGPGKTSILRIGGCEFAPKASSEADLSSAFAAVLGCDTEPALVTASSDLPAGGGLGSSAALGIAIARCLEELAESPAAEREERALRRALAWERVFHGNPSGIDTHAAARGGTFRFVRGEMPQTLRLAVDLWLCVGLSGTGSSTRAMVEGLARSFERRPDAKQRFVGAVKALVENATLAIEAGDLSALGELMNLNQMLLAGEMLSTEELERLVSLARGAGALGAKLTGAGGGGAAIALVPPGGSAAEAVLEAWKSAGFEGFLTRISAAGAA